MKRILSDRGRFWVGYVAIVAGLAWLLFGARSATANPYLCSNLATAVSFEAESATVCAETGTDEICRTFHFVGIEKSKQGNPVEVYEDPNPIRFDSVQLGVVREDGNIRIMLRTVQDGQVAFSSILTCFDVSGAFEP